MVMCERIADDSKSIRPGGLPAKSGTFLEVMQSSLIAGVADEQLLPNCEDYRLYSGQLMQIGAGDTAQGIHRDEDAWSLFKNPKPLREVEAMFALTDFTLANGATRVVPDSPLWPADRKGRPGEDYSL